MGRARPGTGPLAVDKPALVRKGYNLASYAYRSDSGLGAYRQFNYNEWFQILKRRLAKGAVLLELGCGNGLPMGRMLARRFEYYGTDISELQVRRAKRLVPA